ncbi:hypothetical protein, partial [Klebsiella pneumoniae]|uniref:hypothetical protein n=1 Tax=Klebsiella pneumoniae TaxID=573 RepID=UPI0024DE3F2E
WLMMSLWDALRMNMMISYQELVRTFPNDSLTTINQSIRPSVVHILPMSCYFVRFFPFVSVNIVAG